MKIKTYSFKLKKGDVLCGTIKRKIDKILNETGNDLDQVQRCFQKPVSLEDVEVNLIIKRSE